MSTAIAWLEKARSDLDMVRRAMSPLPDNNPEQAAYHLQQAAEKALKALLVHLGVGYPRGAQGHDIAIIASQLPSSHPLASAARGLGALTPWSTAYRYPSDDPMTAPSIPSAAEIETWRLQIEAFIHDAESLFVGGSAAP